MDGIGLDRKRGVGKRRSEIRREAEEGHIHDGMWEFLTAVSEYKKLNDISFPSYSELFEIMIYLGYRKVAEPSININRITIWKL